MSKIIDLFTEVDPFIEFTPKERTRSLVVLHFNVTILSILGFLAYATFSVFIFIATPEPSQLSEEIIYTNMTTEPMFQLVISTMKGQTVCQYPYKIPFNNVLTNNIQTYNIEAKTTDPSYTYSQDYTSYKFPIYGTVDAKTQLSSIVIFNLCYTSTSTPALLAIGNNPNVMYDKLNIIFTNPGVFTDIRLISDDPGFKTNLIYITSSINIMNIEIILKKTVMSNGKIIYDANFNAPTRYVPSPFGPVASNIQQIIATISPTVSVLTYKEKNYLSFIGSVAGIFPLFMLIGNKLSAKIDGCKKRGKEDEIAMEERGVLDNRGVVSTIE